MKQKTKLAHAQIQEQYDKYVEHVFKYPKSQFCYFNFKGICQLPNCQFAHGVNDFNLNNFLSLLKDKDAFQSEKQSEWQKPYFYRLIPKEKLTFDLIFEYQNKHLSSFSQIYTQQELILDSLKRMDIRREINKEIYIEFSITLLKHFTQLDKAKFFQYFPDAGFCYSLQPYSKLSIYYSKKIKNKTSKKTQEIIRLYPSNEEMMNEFVRAIEEYSSSPTCKDPYAMFPMSFASMNSIISKHIDQYAPNPNHFIERNAMSQKLFCEELVKHILTSAKLSSFIGDRKDLSDFYVTIDLNDFIDEIKGTFWSKHYSGHNTQFGFIDFDFIEKTFDLIGNKEFSHESIRMKLLFELYKMKNFFFIDNTTGLYIFNYARFLSNDYNDFVESYYHKRCGLIDKAIVNESLALFQCNNKEEEGNQLEANDDAFFFKEPIQTTSSITSALTITSPITKKGDIVLIDNESSLNYFISQILHSQIISIDLEGDLSAGNINLIQICDQSNEIFVIDIHTFLSSKDKQIKEAIPLLKQCLVCVFESHKIKKLFFDGRNDINALHKQFKICPNNYVDLSVLYSVIKCFKAQIEFTSGSNAVKEFDTLIKQQFNASSRKGLNTVLAEYNTDNKTNELKESMHKLMDEKPFEYFLFRPINEEFLLYSALDVKYLKTTYFNMRTVLMSQIKTMYGSVDESKIDLCILVFSVNHLNYGCRKGNESNV